MCEVPLYSSGILANHDTRNTMWLRPFPGGQEGRRAGEYEGTGSNMVKKITHTEKLQRFGG